MSHPIKHKSSQPHFMKDRNRLSNRSTDGVADCPATKAEIPNIEVNKDLKYCISKYKTCVQR